MTPLLIHLVFICMSNARIPINENVIKLIRGFDSETIPLVSGFDWAYDLTPLHIDPVEAEGIGYVSHPYEHKREPPWEPKWEEAFGFAAAKYPVIVTEFGIGLVLWRLPAEDLALDVWEMIKKKLNK